MRTFFLILIFVLVGALNLLCLYENEHWHFLVTFTQTKKLATASLLMIFAIAYSAAMDWKERKKPT
ncbi:hypothetical protein [Paenibacillus glycanilyticus]|uniref:Uncharacterized protein n=1 Tax=Paenibacillus glycanilyticus TaxID=126569 RepID=A0ABQ6GJT1_9BACL|nr:hypothetical protein [Paenibacillus glycanilyticus]GLX70475.1 hypothetical protein MU1_48210 [Paenibacillus glycanilyticus]